MIGATLQARGLKPIAELAANRPHGDRLRYLAGCKCMPCRRANSRYESMRAQARRNGDWNGLVSAKMARRHLLKLSRQGIGRRAVAIAADVTETMICAIKSKKKKYIRARSERKILSVTKADACDHSFVPARRTWHLIKRLKIEGYTTRQLADRLKYKTPVLQFGKEQVTVRNAFRVKRMYRQLMIDD